MWRSFSYLLAIAIVLNVVRAQQEPIYVPFDWSSGAPVSASRLGVSGDTTTFALIDASATRLATPGPATLIQSPGGGSMIYAAPSQTLSGVCNLATPVALCTLNVYETGAAFPSTGLPKSGPTSKSGRISGATRPSSWQGTMVALGTAVAGFLVAVSLLR